MSRSVDVVVVGAGLIGCAIARELALRGAAVTVLERDTPGRHATWAAAGMLSPLGEAGGAGPFLELSDESLRLYPAFAAALHEESTIDVEYRTCGKLHVSFGDCDDELLELASSAVAGRFGIRLLDAEEARVVEPGLGDGVTSALLVERDHRVNNRLLAQALHAAAAAAGAVIRAHRSVTAIEREGNAVRGVRLESGERIDAPVIVLAAGAWSGSMEGLPRSLPVRPVKGQLFAVDGAAFRVPRRVLFGHDCYIVPRDDGRLLVGATQEEAGFSEGPTPRGIHSLMDGAMRVLPSIADMPLLETWAGFRPATPDGLPILGADPEVQGLVYATGHFRNGILLAPVTARYVADVITGGGTTMPLEAFGISRFRTES